MRKTLNKKSIIRKTIQVGGLTMLSRLLAIVREILFYRFLGQPGLVTDAFFTAYKIPNSFRKIFAEGALSAAIVPTLVKNVRKGDRGAVNRLMSLAFLVFEGLVLLLCAFFMWKAEAVIAFIAPGFDTQQVMFTARLLKILMPFIFFLSSSALLAGALQAVHKFFVPAISPALLNVVFIISLLACLAFDFPIEYLCFSILIGGFLQFVVHVIAYFKANFSFYSIDKGAVAAFGHVMKKFLPCAFSMSIVEISLFIDTSFASFLPGGSISLIRLSNRFMGIPLGVFAVAFSTILLPHFSRISQYAPKRISFYVLEATKFVFWVAIPVACVMIFFSENILSTFFYFTGKFSADKASEGANILVAYLLGLFFLSLNKILLSIYYAFHNTWIPTIVSIFATSINFALNMLMMRLFMATGIALATSISALIQTVLFILFLHYVFGFTFYCKQFVSFLVRFLAQLFVVFGVMYIIYRLIYSCISTFSEPIARFFLVEFGIWFWIGPLILIAFWLIYCTREYFKTKLYFLD